MPVRRGRRTAGNRFLDTIINRVEGSGNFVLGNAKSDGLPVVYCSEGFFEITGFRRSQVIGKRCSCSFLYGALTKEESKQKVEDALIYQQETKVNICLYTKYGNPFWCQVEIIPITNENQEVVLFLVSFYQNMPKDQNIESEITEHDPDILSSPTNESNFQKRKQRGRQVLFNLSKQFKSSRKKMSQLDKLQEAVSGQQTVPEYKVEVQKKGRGIILHYGFVKVLWDWLIMLCTFYIAIMVPFNAAFIVGEFVRTTIYADVAVEIIFGIDIILNFRTTYVSNTGQVIYDGKLIALNYIKQWFLMDLLAAIPFDLLYAFQVETGTLIPLLKVARLLRLIRLFQKMDRYSQYGSVVIILLLSMFTLTAHWLACVWYSIGKFELQKHPTSWRIGWLNELADTLNRPIMNRTHLPDMWSCYLTALYFTCSSLTTVGFGNVSANTNAEKIFSVCAMLIGAMMYALVFGNVTAIVQRAYARRATFHMKTNDLKEFYHTYNIPKPLKHRIQDYFQSMWTMNNGINLNELFYEFPDEMKGEISMHLHKEILSLPLFKCATHGCMKAISLQIRRTFCAPGEYLIHRGDAISYLYFILSGSLEILKDDKVVALLGKGDLFGIDLQFEDPVASSSCSVKSLTYCELQCINLMGFISVLSLYPSVAEKIANAVQQELTFNLKDCEIDLETENNFDNTRPSIIDGDDRNNCNSSAIVPRYLLPGSGDIDNFGRNNLIRRWLRKRNTFPKLQKQQQRRTSMPVPRNNASFSSSSTISREDMEIGNNAHIKGKVNFQNVVEKITKRKNIQNTLRRKIQEMKKLKTQKEDSQKNLENSSVEKCQMKEQIICLTEEMNRVHHEVRSALHLLCELTNKSMNSVLEQVTVPEVKIIRDCPRDSIDYNPDSQISECTDDNPHIPSSPRLTISSKALADLTDTEFSDNLEDSSVKKKVLQLEAPTHLEDTHHEISPQVAPRKSKEANRKSSESPQISVIFEPNSTKLNCPVNSNVDILRNRGQSDRPQRAAAESSSTNLTKPLPLGLTNFPFADEDNEKKSIVTEMTNV
ncbi:potassium voltage-gated channel subfamily H member 8-like isoform X2 [Octopus sinensis]|uniref:Potassium voltage-gated channel subfamily H member 8-like isoform X2 n=1 Tax=Octopus sinensis TaxID=2607531 RepID=A0A7E6FJU1_9MOLL|nr:potassium voltage-gated channel subfamily H member 8-like isoform X2 [Octopus sinensis]